MTETVQLCDPTDIASQMKRGDTDALERLTRCYGERLLAIGRRHCRDDDEARDAVQDALLAAGENLRSFRGEGSPEGWLVRIVANACRRMRRGRKNDPALHEELSSQPLSDPEASPEDDTRRAEIAAALGEALLELSPLDRALFLLAEAEGWTGPELGEHFDLTPNAVRIRLSRIRARLRPALEPLLA